MTDRRGPQPGTPDGYLQHLPALVLLDRLPVSTLAVTYEGMIVYANPAAERMLGYESGELVDKPVDTVLDDERDMISGDGVKRVIAGHAGRLITLRHADGSPVRTVASESVLVRHDDPMALVVFHDVTDELWMNGERT